MTAPKPKGIYSCDGCGGEFEPGSRSKFTVDGGYCSHACWLGSTTKAEQLASYPLRGPCGTCGVKFRSESPRKYCTVECFKQSGEYEEARRRVANRSVGSFRVMTSAPRQCVQCGKTYKPRYGYVGPQMAEMFCNSVCSRRWRALRYDRWFADPKVLNKLQGYDAWLGQKILACTYPGCAWRGHQLTTHMGLSHGIPKNEFKRVQGVSLSTGVTSVTLKRFSSLVQKEQGGEKIAKMQAGKQQKRLQADQPKEILTAKRPEPMWDDGLDKPKPLSAAASARVVDQDKPQRPEFHILSYKSEEFVERRKKSLETRRWNLQCRECSVEFESRSCQRHRCYTCQPVSPRGGPYVPRTAEQKQHKNSLGRSRRAAQQIAGPAVAAGRAKDFLRALDRKLKNMGHK